MDQKNEKIVTVGCEPINFEISDLEPILVTL
jgi:hypothetical protein